MTSQALHAGRTRLFHSTISGRNTYLSMFPTFQVTLSSCPLQVANKGNVRICLCLTIRCLLNKSQVEAGFSWTRSSLDYLDETIANWESLELKLSKARTFRLVYADDRLRVRVWSSEHAHFENYRLPNRKRVLSTGNSYSSSYSNVKVANKSQITIARRIQSGLIINWRWSNWRLFPWIKNSKLISLPLFWFLSYESLKLHEQVTTIAFNEDRIHSIDP